MAAQEVHPDIVESKFKKEDEYSDTRSNSDIEGFGALVAAESENAIQYRTCSWQKVRIYPLRCEC